jgi:vacuolar-type H+-ATPase subunit D/Vma8
MWQEYLNGLDEDARANANAALMNAGVQGGKAAQDAIKAMFMGIPPLTDASRIYHATMRQGTSALQEQVKIAQNGRSLAENQLAMDRQMARAIRGNIDDLEQFRTVMQAGGMTGDALAGAMIDVQKAVQIYRQKGLNTEEEMLQAIQEARREQGRLTNQQVKDAVQAEQSFKNLTTKIMAALLPAIERLSKPITDLAIRFANFLGNEGTIKKLESSFNSIIDFIIKLFSEETRAQALSDMKNSLIELTKGMFDIIKNALVGPKIETEDQQADYERRNRENKEVMTFGERSSTFAAEFLEGFLGLLSEETAKRIAADRIDRDSAEAAKRRGRSTGSLGSTGNLFENFGNSSLIEAHGYEAVMTPAQLGDLLKSERTETAKTIAPTMASPNTDDDRLVKSSIEQGKTLVAELQTLNKQTADMMRYMRDTSEYTRKNLDAIRGLNGNLFAA